VKQDTPSTKVLKAALDEVWDKTPPQAMVYIERLEMVNKRLRASNVALGTRRARYSNALWRIHHGHTVINPKYHSEEYPDGYYWMVVCKKCKEEYKTKEPFEARRKVCQKCYKKKPVSRRYRG
jgi:hypothetical protein